MRVNEVYYADLSPVVGRELGGVRKCMKCGKEALHIKK